MCGFREYGGHVPRSEHGLGGLGHELRRGLHAVSDLRGGVGVWFSTIS